MNILHDKWPCCRRAAEQRDELAAIHSITSSASATRTALTTWFRPHLRTGIGRMIAMLHAAEYKGDDAYNAI